MQGYIVAWRGSLWYSIALVSCVRLRWGNGVLISSLKRQRVSVALAELLLLGLIQAAEAQELSPPPGYVGWTIINKCGQPIRVALHYAPADEILTEGWLTIEPDDSVEVFSTTEYVAYFVAPAAGMTSDERRSSGQGVESGGALVQGLSAENAVETYALAIDLEADFRFTGFEPPPGMQGALYTAVDIDEWLKTSISCAGGTGR
jgi:hypothetical protein